MPGDPDGGAPSGAYVVQPSGPHEAIRDGIQRRNPFPAYTSLYDTYGAESRSLTAARPPVRAAASSTAMVGAQVHTCPTTPTGTPAARHTHTMHVIPRVRRKRSLRGGVGSTEPLPYLLPPRPLVRAETDCPMVSLSSSFAPSCNLRILQARREPTSGLEPLSC